MKVRTAMDENSQSPNVKHNAETDGPVPELTTVQVFDHSPAKRSKLAFLRSPRIVGLGVLAMVVLSSLGLYGHHLYARNSAVQTPAENLKPTVSSTTAEKNKATVQDATTLQQQTAQAPSNSTSKTAPKPSAPSSIAPSALAPTSAPAPNTTNCLPPNPSPYATEYTTMTNSQYLQTNGYVNTTKLYAALQFAGLINTINSRQYVVLAMDDSQWNNFTQAQLNWMNASPANMRSVLGWQIITSCITWDGVNPVKDMVVGTNRTVTTLNGAVTYTHGTSGLGTFGNGRVGIWDWFTSNGSVTVAGFVNTSSIPAN